MKSVPVLICLIFSITAFADVKIVQRVRSDAFLGLEAEDKEMIMYVKGQKARMEDPASGSHQIFDLDTGKIFFVDSKKREITIATAGQMKQMMSVLGAKDKVDADIKRLGKTENYNGFKCEQYKISISVPDPIQGVYCVSKEIRLENEIQALIKFSPEVARMFGGEVTIALSGFPVHTESTQTIFSQQGKSSTDLISYSFEKLPDSLFQVPTDYETKTISIPNLKQEKSPETLKDPGNSARLSETPEEKSADTGNINQSKAIVNPVLIKKVEPVYPEGARQERVEGVVELKYSIDQNGNVTVLEISKPLHPLLDQAAADALKQWKYTPATLHGEPRKVFRTASIKFSLNKPSKEEEALAVVKFLKDLLDEISKDPKLDSNTQKEASRLLESFKASKNPSTWLKENEKAFEMLLTTAKAQGFKSKL